VSIPPISATSYVRTLAESILHVQVTDSDGANLSLDDGTHRAVEMLLSAGTGASKVLLVGNGGSAAIASHTHNDLSHAVGIPSMVFYDQSLLTTLSNDYGYEFAFERLAELWAAPGDVLIAISSSGKSNNILRTVRVCQARNCHIITFSGFKPDNPLRHMGHLNFYVPAQEYGCVELAHHALTHCMTDCAAVLRAAQ
jgi:D-sedoheptulose 7-phosphate isomerase